jgi:hypothetical protein
VVVTARHHWSPADEQDLRRDIIKTFSAHAQGPVGVARIVRGTPGSKVYAFSVIGLTERERNALIEQRTTLVNGSVWAIDPLF